MFFGFFLIFGFCRFCEVHRDWLGVLSNDHFLTPFGTPWRPLFDTLKTTVFGVFNGFHVSGHPCLAHCFAQNGRKVVKMAKIVVFLDFLEKWSKKWFLEVQKVSKFDHF